MTGLQLFLVREPRSFIIATIQCALIFKQPPGDQDSTHPSVVVELLPRSELPESAVLLKNVNGCLGLLRIGDGQSDSTIERDRQASSIHLVSSETFLPIITSATTVGTSARQFTGYGVEPINRILAVEFFCLTSAAYDSLPSSLDTIAPPSDFYDDSAMHQSRADVYEHPCTPVRKILSAGTFYYSSSFDLSTRLQARLIRAEQSTTDHEKPKEGASTTEEVISLLLIPFFQATSRPTKAFSTRASCGTAS